MDTARNRPEDLFAALNINLRRSGYKKYIGCCPVHGGDSDDSLRFYPDGTKCKAFWTCLSNHCERTFTGSLLGFVQGVLSHNIKGWESGGDWKKMVSKDKAIEFLCDFLKSPWEDIKVDLSLAQRNQFVAGIENLTLSTPERINKGICSRERLRNLLEIPAEYYIERGYSPAILDKYDVGLCLHPASDLYGRVVVPIYSDDGKYVMGCIGRSVHPECGSCKKFHHPNAECFGPNVKAVDYCKWRCSNRFNDKNFLYNMWNAAPHILKNRRTVVIVEGCGDVWRLEEGGIRNAVALNGSDLTDTQEVAIECSGATTILCLTDADEAGDSAYRHIVKKCSHIANVVRIRPEGSRDVGELNINNPLFDKIKSVCNA